MLYGLKLILNSLKDLALSLEKQILTGLLVTKIYKNRTMNIFLFSYSMLDYISPITTSLPHIYTRNVWIPDWNLSIIPTRNISTNLPNISTNIWELCRSLQPGIISCTLFCKKLDFPSVNHNRYIKLHLAQFPMIGNTYLELKLLKIPL